MLVGCGLGVVALQKAVLALDHARVQIGGVDHTRRNLGRRVRLGRRGRPEPPAAMVLAASTRAQEGLVGASFGPELLVQTPLGLADALGPVARDRRALGGALIIQ